MKEMVHERQNSQKVERHDLFTTLLDANTNEAGDDTLTENELISKSPLTASRMRPHELLIVMQATFSFSYLPDMRCVPYITFIPTNKQLSDDCAHTLLCICTFGVIPRRTGEVIPTYQIYYTRWSDSRTSIFVSGFRKMQAEGSLPDLRRNASFRVFDGVSRLSIADSLIIDSI